MTDAVDVLWDRPDRVDDAMMAAVIGWGRSLLDAAGATSRTLSIVITDDPGIRALNLQWRDVDEATDVLSFPMDEGESPASPAPMSPLGDVVLSLETAERQASGRNYTLHDEVRFLLVHGICHLLGHDHGEPEEAARMRSAETELLDAIAPGQRRPDTPY